MQKLLVVAALVACGPKPEPAMLPVDPDPHLAGPSVRIPPQPPMPDHPWPATVKGDTVEVVQGVKISDPYRWLEDDKRQDVQAWMKTQDEYTRAELAKLPGRTELAARLKELNYYDAITAPTHKKGRYFYSRKHVDKGEVGRLLEAGRERRREGVVRSEHVERRWQQGPRLVLAEPRWQARRVRGQGAQLRRDRHARDRGGERQGAPRRHPRDERLACVVASRRQGLLLRLAPAGLGQTDVCRPARLRRVPLSPAGDGSCEGSDHPPRDEESRAGAWWLPVRGRQVARRRHLARLEFDGPVLQGREEARNAVDDPRQGRRRDVRDLRVARSVLHRHERRRAEWPRLQGRSEAPRAHGVEGDRAAE